MPGGGMFANGVAGGAGWMHDSRIAGSLGDDFVQPDVDVYLVANAKPGKESAGRSPETLRTEVELEQVEAGPEDEERSVKHDSLLQASHVPRSACTHPLRNVECAPAGVIASPVEAEVQENHTLPRGTWSLEGYTHRRHPAPKKT